MMLSGGGPGQAELGSLDHLGSCSPNPNSKDGTGGFELGCPKKS